MDKSTVLAALFTLWGVGGVAAFPTQALKPAAAAQTVAAVTEAPAPTAAIDQALLVNRVWVRAEADDGLPGSKQIFLSDGTLVSDSCWETYRLSQWEWLDATHLSWEEDTMTIPAQVLSLTDAELVLRLDLVSESLEQRYVPADVPFVCPDMER